MAVYVLGISGASGAPYAQRVLHGLLLAGHDVKAVVTEAGRRVLDVEMDLRLTGAPEADQPILRRWAEAGDAEGTLELFDDRDVAAPIASGSFPSAGMAIVPCSMGTLGRIAHGVSSNLLERAADVCLKERRRLIVVPRETPLSLVHLRNMTALTEAGAIVLPGMPGFYHRPRSVQDLVDMVAGRVLAHLGVDSPLLRPWLGAGRGSLAGVED
jgi:4-hydroxy-3-polyprenylbenzoate decarboxylase